MSTSTQAVVSTPTSSFAKRSARTLIGWLSEREGALWIAGRQMTESPDPAHLAICQRARAAVAARQSGVDQRDLFSPLPPEVEPHIQALRANEKSAQIVAASGEPRIVDLRRVCAAQPTISTEDALKRVDGVLATDFLALAKVTLPLPEEERIPVAFDPMKNAWLLSSPNPNLRVAGSFQAPVGPGILGYGFAIALLRSYLQVSGVNGRYFLRDGYHRAYGFLAAGITHVPALVKDFASFEDVQMPAGLLPSNAYLGSRPPLLLDYLSNEVAGDSSVPVTTKMIAIQALELSSIG